MNATAAERPTVNRDIGDLLQYPCVFRWTLVCIPPGYLLNLGNGFFLNRGGLSMVLKTTLVPRYVYSDTSLGGVPYMPSYQFWPLF